jgi:type 1 glutamine amidotransferase
MKILGKKKNKLVNVDKIEIALTIKELETLIGYLNQVKSEFNERQKENDIVKVKESDGIINLEKIINYTELVESGNETIGCHSHFKDCVQENDYDGTDIIIHTAFKAKENEDGTFCWENISLDENINGNKKHKC